MSASKYYMSIITCTVFVALISIIIQGFFASKDLQRITKILSNLVILENVKKVTNNTKIVVGFGSCSDLFVGLSFLNYTDDILNNSNEEFEGDITNEQELLQSFAYYFQFGAASERYTPDSVLFQKLIRKAKRGEHKFALGGNAPVMGLRFLKEGADVLLAGQMSHKLKSTLPHNIKLTGDPVDKDDIHLIIEYKAGEKWGEFIAPRANRYILHNDENNPTISSLEQLDKVLYDFNTNLFVVSGLQMMDNFPFSPGVRELRLAKVKEQISILPKTALIHFEMASYVEIKLLQLLLENITPYTDSIGMNEQELDNLNQVLEKGTVSYISDSNPRVATALHQMRNVFKTINKNYFENIRIDVNRRMLTRIHVHTLAYQAFLVVRDSSWKNTKNAAAKSSLTAFRHVCQNDQINPESAYIILDDSFSTSPVETDDNQIRPKRIQLNLNDPVSCWNETISISTKLNEHKHLVQVEICVAPVLVCKVAKQTAGGGDNISAAGLILQI